MLDAHGAPLLIDFGSTRPARRAVRSRREALELQVHKIAWRGPFVCFPLWFATNSSALR
jgi:hypothetical protein